MSENQDERGRCGLVAIVGRPNVGKSTLLNALVGEKISIVTAKPHTTRRRVLGVLNRGEDQAVFIDTPGHAQRTKRALHRLMARQIHQAVEDCDVALLLVEAHVSEARRVFGPPGVAWRDASPINHLSQADTTRPFLLVMGERDYAGIRTQTETMRAALADHHIPVEVVDIPGRDHYELVSAIGSPGDSLTGILGRFLAR